MCCIGDSFFHLMKQNKMVFFFYHNLPNTKGPTVLTRFSSCFYLPLDFIYTVLPPDFIYTILPPNSHWQFTQVLPVLSSFHPPACVPPVHMSHHCQALFSFLKGDWFLLLVQLRPLLCAFVLKLSVWITVICVHESLPLKHKVLHRLFNHVLFYSETQHHHWNFFFFWTSHWF